MKGITAYYILKRKNLIHKKMPYKNLKFLKQIFGIERWGDFVRHIMMIEYLVGTMDLADPIRVPEVNFQIGGTVRVEV